MDPKPHPMKSAPPTASERPRRQKSDRSLPALDRRRLRASLLRDQVLKVLRQAIVELQLKPGDLLVERELIEWTGVSRATIREVLRQLTAEGLVRTIPQKGTIVAAPSPTEARELYEIRATLEGLAAKQFAERAGDKDRKDIKAALRHLEQLAASGSDVRTLLQVKNQFYTVLLRGAYNKTLQSLLNILQARIAMLRATSMSHPGRPPQSVEEMRAVVEAIERGDGPAAEKASVFHVQQAARYALAELGEEEEQERTAATD